MAIWILRQQIINQRQNGIGFADRGGMHPDKVTIGALHRCVAEALFYPARVFFAHCRALAKPKTKQRRSQKGDKAIQPQNGH